MSMMIMCRSNNNLVKSNRETQRAWGGAKKNKKKWSKRKYRKKCIGGSTRLNAIITCYWRFQRFWLAYTIRIRFDTKRVCFHRIVVYRFHSGTMTCTRLLHFARSSISTSSVNQVKNHWRDAITFVATVCIDVWTLHCKRYANRNALWKWSA